MGKDHLRKDQTNEDSASKNIMNASSFLAQRRRSI